MVGNAERRLTLLLLVAVPLLALGAAGGPCARADGGPDGGSADDPSAKPAKVHPDYGKVIEKDGHKYMIDQQGNPRPIMSPDEMGRERREPPKKAEPSPSPGGG